MLRKAIATTALLAATATAGGALLGPVTGAFAQTPTTTSAAAAPAAATPRTTFENAIKGLVTDGTLTQAQADKVLAAHEATRPPRDDHGPGPGLDVAATALGLTPAALRTELDGGKTIAQVATAKGVALTTVIDALVKDENTHIDADVAAGRITKAEADARKTHTTERATDLVNGVRPAGGPGRPGPRP